MLIGIVVYRLHEVFPAKLLVFRPALLAAIVGVPILMSAARAYDRRNLTRHRMVQLSGAYVAWAICGVPFALWRTGAIDRVMGLLPLLTLVVGFALISPTEQVFRTIGRSFVVFAVLLGVAALLQDHRMSGRLTATYSFDPNSLAAMMALSAPFAVQDALRAGAMRRLWNVVAVVLMTWVILQTQSRGSLIGFAAGMFVFVLFQPPRVRVWTLALAITGAIGVWLAAPSDFRERLSTSTDDYNVTERGGRVQIWTRGLGYFASNPLMGVGAGNFVEAEGRYNKENSLTGKWSAPHNTLVEVFAELGLPGGVLLIWMFASAFSSAVGRGSGQRSPPLASALAATAVSGMFLGLAYFWGFFALFGLGMLTDRRRLNQAAALGRRP